MQSLQNRPWYKYYSEEQRSLKLPENSLYDVLKESVEKYRNDVAITFEDETITYKQLKSKVDQLAGAWKKMNLQKGERIGFMIPNHPDYIIGYYAAIALGLIVVQINPNYTPRELLHILEDAQVSYIVVNKTSLPTIHAVEDLYTFKKIFTSQIGEKRKNTIPIEECFSSQHSLQTPTPINVKEDIAVIQYTGGTTGKIKGAMLTHFNLVSNVYQSYMMYRQKILLGGETILAATPLYHVYGMTSAMNLGIFIGANILLIPKFETNMVLEKIKKSQPTFFPGVPKMYISFVNHPHVKQYGLTCLKICSSGSAPLPIEIIKKFEEITGTTIHEGFGMSETSPTTHRNPVNGKIKIGSIGIPVPGTDSCIVDDSHKPLKPKMVGELVIKGPQVMKGYWNNETETRQVLRNGWLFTGDLAMMDEDGYFYIVGRKKEMIISSGFNIYPQEIESVLYEHHDIEEAAVIGIPDKINGEIVKAFVVPKKGCMIDLEEVRSYCYEKLTPYKVPKLFEVRESLPRNGVGKLLKRQLVKEELEKGESENGH
ncbi:long-chain fatty acid--CoA ligase [Bacillus smithii]|uniref:long-chain-fatty-acid--CoA ligase n=1 Tax=Bacillus smithii TaxID=1479 RepID=UPI003D252183